MTITEKTAYLKGLLEGMEIVDQICQNTPVADGNGTVLAPNQPVIVRIDRNTSCCLTGYINHTSKCIKHFLIQHYKLSPFVIASTSASTSLWSALLVFKSSISSSKEGLFLSSSIFFNSSSV